MKRRRTFWKVGVIVFLAALGFQSRALCEERYIVKSGDNLYGIAKKFGVEVDVLREANGLKGNAIKPNQVLIIKESRHRVSRVSIRRSQGKAGTYEVKKGDSIDRISKRVGLSIEEIKKMNSLPSDPAKIGQALIVSKPEPRGEEQMAQVAKLGEPAEDLWLARREPGQEISKPLDLWLAREEETDEISQPLDLWLACEEGRQGTSKPLDLWLVRREKKAGVSESFGRLSGTSDRTSFVQVVKTFLGVPYRLGGYTLRGIDCSGLVKKIYSMFNIEMPRTTQEQSQFGRFVEKENLEEGDLVFFKIRPSRYHVGIYIGNNEFVHASTGDRHVKVDRLTSDYFTKRFVRGVRVAKLSDS